MDTQPTPVTDLIKRRFSCRIYSGEPIDEERQSRLKAAIDTYKAGPFASSMRFSLVAATEEDRSQLRGLGAYGSIKGASAFIVGAVGAAAKDLEDYGYVLERLVLKSTEIGLGTCWLGGFTRNTFSRSISAQQDEQVPAVVAVGVMDETVHTKSEALRQRVSGDKRLPWERLFFDGSFGTPLSAERAGKCADALEMVRLGPSASNKQPWRIVRDGEAFHLFLQRTPGYATRLVSRIFRVADLQRVDMGIAMCHFEAVALEAGLHGAWVVREEVIETPDSMTEYVASWVE